MSRIARRSVLAAAAVVPVVGTAPAADPHMSIAAELTALEARLSVITDAKIAAPLHSPEHEALTADHMAALDRCVQVEAVILATPARTAEGLMVQLDVILSYAENDGIPQAEADCIWRNFAGTLERLSGRPVRVTRRALGYA